MRILVLVFFFAGFFYAPLMAQLNFKVGYNSGYSNPEVYNQIIEDFNESRPWLEKSLDKINYLHGLQLGIRYRFGPAALDFSFHNRFKLSRSNGTDPATETAFSRDINFSLKSYALGVEGFAGPFSYGASFDMDNLTIRTKKTGRNDRFTVVDQFGTGSHFFVSYTIDASPQMDFSIRPYVHFPWSTFDLRPLSDELDPAIDYEDYEESYMNFGVMFIFFNGE